MHIVQLHTCTSHAVCNRLVCETLKRMGTYLHGHSLFSAVTAYQSTILAIVWSAVKEGCLCACGGVLLVLVGVLGPTCGSVVDPLFSAICKKHFQQSHTRLVLGAAVVSSPRN